MQLVNARQSIIEQPIQWRAENEGQRCQGQQDKENCAVTPPLFLPTAPYAQQSQEQGQDCQVNSPFNVILDSPGAGHGSMWIWLAVIILPQRQPFAAESILVGMVSRIAEEVG